MATNDKNQYKSRTIRLYSKRKKIKLSFVLLIAVAIIINLNIKNMFAFFTSMFSITNEFSIETDYTIHFDANGGTGSMADQPMSFNTPANLYTNTFTNAGCVFNGWNTLANGLGEHFTDGQLITNMNIGSASTITLYAEWISDGSVARIGSTTYPTLQAAIDGVSTNNNPAVTIYLLKDIEEEVRIPTGKSVIIDLQNHTIINDQTVNDQTPTTYPVIENSGTLTIMNGTISSNSKRDGVVNNKPGATITITDMTIEMTNTNGKQAFYNEGTATISGNSNLSSVSASSNNKRATVQNTPNGTLTVLSGTIVSESYIGLRNDGDLTLGELGGGVSKTSPSIQGATIGLDGSAMGAGKTIYFYDGIVKGKSNSINVTIDPNNIEPTYDVCTANQQVGTQTYKVAYLAQSYTVTLDPTGGTISNSTIKVEIGNPLGPTPTPEKSGHIFSKWVDANNVEYNANTTIPGSMTLYAVWIEGEARIGTKLYSTVKAAVDSVKTSNLTTIEVLRDSTTKALKIDAGENVIIELNNHTLSNDGSVNIFQNSGTLTIQNGTLTSNINQGIINNNSTGNLTIDNCQILATSTSSRQGIYNTGGTVTITGNSTLSSKASGTNARGTIQNLDSGTVYIRSGTIISVNHSAIVNESGTVEIGEEGGGVDTSSPEIIGQGTNKFGVENAGTLNFYDGVIKGKSAAISGSLSAWESGYQKTETLDSGYYTAILTAI